jgi:hypothetical protein
MAVSYSTPEAHFATLVRNIPNETDYALVLRHAPRIRFDAREPFLALVIGYTIYRENAESPSFPRDIMPCAALVHGTGLEHAYGGDVPPPPPTPLCDSHNFDEGGVVRASTSDVEGYAINCRVLYQNGRPTTWLGIDLYNAGSIGVEEIFDLGVVQAIDIFSPSGLTHFTGGAVFCLRGSGTPIWLAASQSPHHAEIIGNYTMPEFPGFTCVTLFEPGTLVLVHQNPMLQ